MATPKQQHRRDSPSSTPLSPSVTSRRDEKDQMVNLNNRMAVYVEKVRSLETENSRLQIQITNFEQTNVREVENVKSMYESELVEARRLLDELSKEKAQLQIEATSFREKYESEKARANELQHDYSLLEGKLKDTSAVLSMKESQYTRTKAEKDELQEELDNLKARQNDLQEEFDSTQKMLENETLQRVDFENKLQSLREDLLFKERIFQEELSEVRKRHTVSVTEIDEQVKGVYENRLEAAIIDLRDQQAADLDQMKDDLEDQYSAKIVNMTKRLDTACQLHLKVTEELKACELKLDRIQSQNKLLQTQNTGLNGRVQELEGQVLTEQELRISAIVTVEKQRDEAREMLRNMEKEYSDLLDLKLKLDHEIGIYRKLLEEEEQRLNLSPSPHVEGSDSKSRARARRKRKRTAVVGHGEGESRAKKQEVRSTTYMSETVVVEKTQRQTAEPDPSPEGQNSCAVM
ncbi:prelamin-A/C-like isoform X2 [Clavelina lepadiformis]|uniref:prelamin-A/C-like isoform X2 n=1 Tax=Clavelina lepadiformis TaxID=159417 RepID=UPI004042D9F0